MTIKENYNAILDALHEQGNYDFDEFLAKRIELTHKTSSPKSAEKKAEENAPIVSAIEEFLAMCNEPQKVADIMFGIVGNTHKRYSTQKLTAVMSTMDNVVREKKGKSAFYCLKVEG